MNNDFSIYIKKYFNQYLPITRSLNLSTIKTYKSNMLLFIKYLTSQNINVDKLELKKISFSIIENYIEYLKTVRKNKNKTINLKLEILKSFFEYLSLQTIDAIDICSKIKKIRLAKDEVVIPNYLTPKEIELLLLQPYKLNNIKELSILALLYECALRVSEICNLKVEDILFDNINKISIKNSKNNNSRIIPISKEVIKILKLYIKEYNLSESDNLFTNRLGNKYTQKGIAYILNKNFILAKNYSNDNTMFRVKNHPHMLRHSKAIHLLESGVDIIIIRDFLGHKNLNTTEIYARITDEKKEKILLENAKNKPLKIRYSKNKINNLETWLKENL